MMGTALETVNADMASERAVSVNNWCTHYAKGVRARLTQPTHAAECANVSSVDLVLVMDGGGSIGTLHSNQSWRLFHYFCHCLLHQYVHRSAHTHKCRTQRAWPLYSSQMHLLFTLTIAGIIVVCTAACSSPIVKHSCYACSSASRVDCADVPVAHISAGRAALIASTSAQW
jgi:hypothetical protein